MVTYRGYKTHVIYDDETSYGVGATPATAIEGRISQVTLNKVNNLIRTVGLGEGRNETFVGFGNFEVTWNMDIELGGFNFLQYAIGPRSGTGTAVAPYYLEESDYMGYAGSAMLSFGMEVGSADTGSTDDEDTLSGCVIDKIGFSLTLGATLKCNIEGYAKTVESSTTSSAFTADTTKPWIFAQGNFKWNGSAVGRVTSIAINMTNGFDPEVGRELGSRTPAAMEMGLRKYDWVATVKMTDTIATTMRDAFYGQADSPSDGIADAEPTFYDIILELSEGSSSGDRNAQILLSDASINDISKPINIGDNIVELTINGAAKKGTTDTTNRPIKWWDVP